MKHFVSLSVLAGFILLIFSSTAPAASLSFDPAAQTVGLGMPVDVGIRISGLGDFGHESLSVFDFAVMFDPTILSFDGVSVVFGSALGPLLGSAQFISGPPDVGLFEVSFDSPALLNASQPESFILATVTFDTVSLGISPLTFAPPMFSPDIILGDENGDPITLDAADPGSVEVAPIPEPTTMVLFGTGLGLMVGLRGFRKWKDVQHSRS